MKNGDERQKLYIINNFYKIFNNYKNQKHLELISQCIKMGIDYCKKLRNDETYKTFFKSIIEFTKILINEKININDTINSIYENIIIHIFRTIPEVDDKNGLILRESLNDILNLEIQLKPFSNEFIDFTTGLGKFGQHVINRKYCIYLSICILRLNNIYNEDIYKRIILLTEDCERMVKYECAYQLRYLYESIKKFIFNENQKYIKLKTINEIYKSYLDDMEISLRTIVIESILYSIGEDNIKNGELIEEMNKHIKNIFNQDDTYLLDEDIHYIIYLFTALTNYLIKIEILDKNLFESFNCFINNFIFLKRKKTFDYSFIFEIFDKVIIVIKKYKANSLLNKLFNHIYTQSLFPPEMDDTLIITNNSFYNSQSDFGDNNKFRNTFINLKNSYKKLFYQHLCIIIRELNNDILTKEVLENIFPFISIPENNLTNKKNNSKKKFNEKTFIKEYSIRNEMREVVYKLDDIFKVFIEINSVNFFYNFFLNFDCFTKMLKNFTNDDKTNKYYILIIKIIKAFENSIEFLFKKFYDNKYEQYENFISHIYNFGIQYLSPETSSYEINIEIIKLFVIIIKFWINRDEIINLFYKNYFQNNSFFYRRFYVVFAQNCYEYLSFNIIKKYKIYENLLDLKDLDSIDIIRNQVDIILKTPFNENIDSEKKIIENKISEKENKIIEERKKDENLLKSIGRNKKYKVQKYSNNSLLTVPNSEKRKKHYIDKKGSMKGLKRRESANNAPFEIMTTLTFSPKSIQRQNSLGNK